VRGLVVCGVYFHEEGYTQCIFFIILAYVEMPMLDYELFTPLGEPGWICSWYAHEDDESMTPLSTPYSTLLVD
jgi:hypothetical protein